ncbi:MAG: ATPase [Bacteroidetes bacterium]|nr:ATPase [Bacteroidota bacterium]
MIIVADSGSTKTDWRIIDNNKTHSFQTLGLNPYFVDSATITNIVREQFPAHLSPFDISHCYFFGAGCKGTHTSYTVQKALQQFFTHGTILVESDLCGAARASFGEQKGIVCILGTGMSIGFWNGSELSYTLPSLGYILGDEGSGAYLGKMLIKAVFEERLPKHCIDDFFATYNTNLTNVLHNVYKEPFPNLYLGDFSRFCTKHKHEEAMQRIINRAFQEFAQLHVRKIAQYTHCNSICFVGSIAYHFEEFLAPVLLNIGISIHGIIQKPIDGLQRYFQSYTL